MLFGRALKDRQIQLQASLHGFLQSRNLGHYLAYPIRYTMKVYEAVDNSPLDATLIVVLDCFHLTYLGHSLPEEASANGEAMDQEWLLPVFGGFGEIHHLFNDSLGEGGAQ